MERAQQILLILELTEFQWTINDVLEQPDPELSAVFMLKAIGEKVRVHDRNAKNPDVEKI